MSNNMEDKTLIDSFLAGDKASFDKLVIKYKDIVFNLCLKMLGNYEEALDVSQDIFIKVYDSLKSFRGEAKFSTYLYRICLNFCKNRLRSLSRRKKKEAFSIDNPISTGEGNIPREFASSNPTPREALNEKERQQLLMEALNSLSPEHREVLILKEIEGMKYEEIASVLNLDLGTVKSRLSRARIALKSKLEVIL